MPWWMYLPLVPKFPSMMNAYNAYQAAVEVRFILAIFKEIEAVDDTSSISS